MAESRRDRRRRQLAERRAATKARLGVPPTPPTVPVALPWRRRPRPWRVRAEGEAWSTVMSHDARDLEGSLAFAAAFVGALGPVLRGRRP